MQEQKIPKAESVSAVIPSLNAEASIGATIRSLAEGENASVPLREILVIDGGSSDDTVSAALNAGRAVAAPVRILVSPRGRGTQLALGGAEAKGSRILFVHADTRLSVDWGDATERFVADDPLGERAGFFRFRADADAPRFRRLETLVELRSRWLRLPYGDQGLLIGRALHDDLGGFRPLPLMEDVDMARRIVASRGRDALLPLSADAVTSVERHLREGFSSRAARNLLCLSLWFCGASPRRIKRLYEGGRPRT